jgi:hypothetical protein
VTDRFEWGVLCGVAIGLWIASLGRSHTPRDPAIVRLYVTVDDVSEARRDTVQKMAEGRS